MSIRTDDLRIRDIRELVTPEQLMTELPCTDEVAATVATARRAMQRILHGQDDRLAVVIGPCSIHDTAAAMEYATRLNEQRARFQGSLEIVMRVYFEKPRTTVGWKGLINDPDLDGSFNINKGLRLARGLLLDINRLGLPAGCEFLDIITPQYIADLVTWGAIGARTTESQVHREMASGLSCPVGFKNGTDGSLQVAVNALQSAAASHNFLGIDQNGRCAVIRTRGNRYGHVVLRGGASQPNYDSVSVALAEKELKAAGLRTKLMVDCSHANSNKDPALQPLVLENVVNQILDGNESIIGVMIESHLNWGNQQLCSDLSKLAYGVSVTDACIDWSTTEACLRDAASRLRSVLGNRLAS